MELLQGFLGFLWFLFFFSPGFSMFFPGCQKDFLGNGEGFDSW